jgi:peptidoglycan/xylan/chitin deacetylase (PgdA/CDA1 family)
MNVRTLKRVVKHTLASAPGWTWLGPIVRAPGVIVLSYHRIRAEIGRPGPRMPGVALDVFTTQMQWIRKHCDPIGPDALIEYAKSPRRARRPPILITFDDGTRDYHDLAYPVLKQLGIPAVVFLATSFLDDGGIIWTDQVEWAAQTTARKRVTLPWSDGPAIELVDGRARSALSARSRAYLKTLPDADRKAALALLLRELDAPPLLERQMLTWDEVRRTMDLTHYGGHSHTHPILSRLGRADAIDEIRTCRDRIGAETGRAPTLFAYPNGTSDDFTPETQQIVRDHGFTVAFSTTEGIAGPDTDWMAVRRLPTAEIDVPDFAWMVAGLMRS